MNDTGRGERVCGSSLPTLATKTNASQGWSTPKSVRVYEKRKRIWLLRNLGAVFLGDRFHLEKGGVDVIGRGFLYSDNETGRVGQILQIGGFQWQLVRPGDRHFWMVTQL